MPSGAPPTVAASPDAAACAAAQVLAERTGQTGHDVLVVLGSGWAGAADAFGAVDTELEVTALPGFVPFTAPGHVGLLRSSRLGRWRVLTVLGRTHLYEGHGPAQVAHAVRTAAAAGCRLAVLTSANGGLRADWPTGTGVLVNDHLNLSGVSSLVGPRFVDQTDAWTPRWRRRVAAVDPGLVDGVYAMLPGPQYQTRAEIGALRTLGADVVGMSTVLEAIAARAAGLDLLGLSVVTTVEAGPGEQPTATDGDQVVRVAAAAASRLGGVVATALAAASHEQEVGHDR